MSARDYAEAQENRRANLLLANREKREREAVSVTELHVGDHVDVNGRYGVIAKFVIALFGDKITGVNVDFGDGHRPAFFDVGVVRPRRPL